MAVTIMGGDKVLIKVDDEEDFAELVKDTKEFFEHWFSDIRPWSPEEVARERYVWVRCQRVPLYA